MSTTLSPSYWTFTSLGICMSSTQIALSVYILRMYLCKNKSYNSKMEYQLIFFRVLLDVLYGVCGFTYYSSGIPILILSLPYDITFATGVVTQNVLEMRSFLAGIIAIERALAAAVPLKFYKLRSRISNLPIIIFIVSTGLMIDIALFGICGFRFPLAPGCNSVTCAVPTCYVTYAAVTRVIYSTTNAFFSGLLCYKLLKKSNSKNVSMDFRKANWLSLTDGMSTLFFDLLPTLIFNSGLIDVKGRGPVMGGVRQTGRALEAVVVVVLMKKKPAVDTRTSVVVY